MIFSDSKIQKMMDLKELVIRKGDGTFLEEVRGSSIDLSLGMEFMEIDTDVCKVLDPKKQIPYKRIFGDQVEIPSKSFWLATTQEFIELPNHVTAFVEGRSSIGRMGLFVQNAGWIAPGFCGKLTLELFNAGPVPVILYVGLRVCQIVLCEMDEACAFPYRGKYQGQSSVWGSLVHEDVT